MITVKDAFPAEWEHEPALLQLEAVKKVVVTGDTIEVSCNKNITPELVRFFVEKNIDVMGVHKKQYGLEEIYEQYFENNLNEDESDGKSSGLFQRSFFKKAKK
jgi:ABC-2 type transport system ATP-binding protein